MNGVATANGATGPAVFEALREVEAGEMTPFANLDALDASEVEWYVSEVGDLFVWFWQAAIEGFVSDADIEVVRERKATRPEEESSNLEWYSRNQEDLRNRYGGQWIAVVAGGVVAHEADFGRLLEATRRFGVERPFVVQVPVQPPVGKMTFGHKIV